MLLRPLSFNCGGGRSATGAADTGTNRFASNGQHSGRSCWGTLVFRYHRKLQDAAQPSSPGYRRMAEVVEPPLAAGSAIMGGNAPVPGALPMPDGKTVFDANVGSPHHFVDEASGRIYDIPWESAEAREFVLMLSVQRLR
jgi:hypothetical protein